MTTVKNATATSTGILLFVIAVFFFALNDALGKWLVGSYSVGQLLLLRAVGALFVIVPFSIMTGVRIFDMRQWPLNLLRVVCMAGDSFCFFYATRTMPLVDVMTYYMAAPFMITALSIPMLGERVALYRWVAVLTGFIGVLIALQPTSGAFVPEALVALFGAFCYAVAMTLTRRMRDMHWITLTGWQFFVALAMAGAVAPFAWVTPSWVDVGLMFLTGFTALACFGCAAQALKLAPASVVAPFHYTSLVWGVLLGWAIWRDVPTWPIIIGNIIITASGLYVWWRELRGEVRPIPAPT